MNEKFYHSGQVYKSYDSIISLVEKNLEGRLPLIGDHNSHAIKGRVVQRIVALTLNPYVQLCSKRLKQGLDMFPNEKEINLNGLSLHTETGDVHVSFKVLKVSFVDFAREWLNVFKSILQGVVAKKKNESAVLIYGIGAASLEFKGSDERFKEFCAKGPITPLVNARRLIVQSTRLNTNQGIIEYSSRPLNSLIISSSFGKIERLELVAIYLILPLLFFIKIVQEPLIALIGRDYALFNALKMLGRKKLIDAIVITNSNYEEQYLWMRDSKAYGFKTHEFHYSQNTKPFVFKEDRLETDYPSFRHVKVDEHWVWTIGYKEYLKKLGHQGPIHVVGSMMFYLPEKAEYQDPAEINIAIFDVTPVYDEVADTMGIINYYYKTSHMLAFMDDIITVCEELNLRMNLKIRLLIKHKRGFSKIHDLEYINYCKNMADKGAIQIIDYDENIYSLMDRCHMAISVPYSSPAYIACERKIISLIYDSTESLMPTFEPCEGLTMVSGVKELKGKLEEIINLRNGNVYTAHDLVFP